MNLSYGFPTANPEENPEMLVRLVEDAKGGVMRFRDLPNISIVSTNIMYKLIHFESKDLYTEDEANALCKAWWKGKFPTKEQIEKTAKLCDAHNWTMILEYPKVAEKNDSLHHDERA